MTLSPWTNTFTLVYLFLCVFFWRVTTHTHTHTHTHTLSLSEELSGLQSADAGRQLGVRRLPSLISRYEVTDGCVPSVEKEKKKWTLTCTPADAASIHNQQPETLFTYRATHTHTKARLATESWHTPLLHVRRDVMPEISSGLSVCISRRQRCWRHNWLIIHYYYSHYAIQSEPSEVKRSSLFFKNPSTPRMAATSSHREEKENWWRCWRRLQSRAHCFQFIKEKDKNIKSQA